MAGQDTDKFRRAVRASLRQATSPEQWEQAAEILFKKEEHAAIRTLKEGYTRVLEALHSAEEKLKNAQKYGAGRTVAPDYLVAEVVPAIESLGEECKAIAHQMTERFK